MVALVPQIGIARAGGIDRFSVDLEPGARFPQVLDGGRMEPTQGVGADADHETAALGHRVN
jgi:hypothetical protein